MLLKVLFLLIILYLAVRTIANLFRAVWNDPRDRQRIPNPPPAERPSGRAAPDAHAGKRRYHVDVEDARWIDVDRS